MSIEPGTRLGPYEITAQIGCGGMGEVYRATDTNLRRAVAIKVLPDAVAADADRLARFQREAEILASLNHPNIAIIHGLEKSDGVTGLVMELVEGPTLADRIAEGPIAMDEALPLAKQIAEALEAAHEQGIIHRDLKPANIKLRSDGTVKVLDFGLAKLADPARSTSSHLLSNSPTMTSPALMTGAGTLLGTAAYMSPEQARGKAVDKRADIWAFGCVLYEMLTGVRAFDGDDLTVVLANIIKSEPDWGALPPGTPVSFQIMLPRCLHKDPKQRLRDIGDARLALGGAFDPPVASHTVAAVALPVWKRSAWLGPAALLAGGITAGLATWWLTRPLPPAVDRLMISHPAPEVPGGLTVDVAISPDGRRVVYLASEGGNVRLYLRPLDALAATRLVNGESASSVFVSPDGQWVGFVDASDQTVKKVATSGGPPLTIAQLPRNVAAQGASWGADDTIVLGASTPNTGLFRVAAGGGSPESLTKPNAHDGERSHALPEVLPGAHAVVFTVFPVDNQLEHARIALLDLRTGARKVLVEGGTNPRYVATGHVIYASAGTLRAVPFDLERLEVRGSPITVLEGVITKPGGSASFAVSSTGTLTYIAGPSNTARTLVWVDRQGREEPIAAPPRAYAYARLSPDGTRIALDVRGGENDIWIWDTARRTMARLTFEQGFNRSPIWSPDGRRLAFSAAREGSENIYLQAPDGSGVRQRVTEGPVTQIPDDFTPDGGTLLFTQPESAPYDLGVVAVGGQKPPELLLSQPYSESNGVISPNGRWLAYQSNESGRDEIYVRPFPNVSGGRTQISTAGGTRPLWARSGRELFYFVPPGTMMRVPVGDKAGFTAEIAEQLFKGNYLSPQAARMYDVTRDGRRFLMIKAAEDGAATPPQLVVVQHWTEELKRLVPTH